MNNKAPAYLFLFPAFLFLGMFALLPMAQIAYYSFFENNLITPEVFVGLDNYAELVSDQNFWSVLLNSFIYLLVTPVLIIISLTLAIAVREETRMNNFFRTLYFLPVITPLVIAGIMWRWIFTEDTGLLNYLLSLLGIGKVSWLSESPQNMFSVMILTVWRGFGYYMMIFLAGLALVSRELEEAAELDGASRLQKVFHIILPQLKPSITLVFVISSASALKIFTELYIMIPGSPMANKTLVYYLFTEAFERFNFGYSSAAGVLLFILTLGFSYANVKISSGAAKE